MAVVSVEVVAAVVPRVSRGHGAHVLQEAVGLVTLVTSLAILEVVTMLRPGLSLTLWAGVSSGAMLRKPFKSKVR